MTHRIPATPWAEQLVQSIFQSCSSIPSEYMISPSFRHFFLDSSPWPVCCPQGKGIQIAHSVMVDDCSGALFVADRENARVLRFAMGSPSRKHTGVATLSRFGQVYAITMGPYGTLLALCWDRQTDKSWVVEVAINEGEALTLGPAYHQIPA